MPDLHTTQQPELLTLTEAAALLRAPIATLRYWRHLGIGPRSFRVGRRVLYRRDDLNTWINTQRDDARRPAGGPDQALSHPHSGAVRHRASQPAPNVQNSTSRR